MRAVPACAWSVATAAGLLLGGLGACGQPAARVQDAGSADDALFTRFVDEVVPILETRCGVGCHGLPTDRYQAQVIQGDLPGLYFALDPSTGRLPGDPSLLREARQRVLGHDDDDSLRVDFAAGPEFSPLLRHPLSGTYGGLDHRGVDVFEDPDDPDYHTLKAWLAAEIAADPAPVEPLSAAERLFRDEVVGVFERNGCFVGSCHGERVFNDLKLTRPLPRTDHSEGALARLSPRMLAANRTVALGKVTRLVNLGGDLTRSRLIVKNLPISEGGVHQRGGNQQFFESLDDPDVALLLRWMGLEQEALFARLQAGGEPVDPVDVGRLQGVAFLRGPRHAPRRFFDPDAWWPGTRLMVLPEGADTPIDLLPGVTGELQAFDVRYDARAIVFSLRTSPDQGFRLYEVALDKSLHPVADSLRRLSYGPDRLDDGTRIHHLDPVYIPGPEDHDGTVLDDVAVAFASNAAGAWASSSAWALLGEADGGDRTTLVDSQRTERAGTFDGLRLHVLDGPMAGSWRTIAAHRSGGRLVLDAPLAEPPDSRTVYVIEQEQPDYRSAFDIWRVVPGRWNASARRMTFTSAQERRPTVRTSGEVMFTSVRNRGWQADRPVYNGAIYRIMAGGFDYHIQGGNRSRYPLLSDSRELPSGLEIRTAQDPRNLWGGGLLLLADHGFGVHLEPDNPVDHVAWTGTDPPPDSASVRFLPAQLPLVPETGPDAITHTGLSPGGAFRDPYPLSDGTLLVARTRSAIDHLDPDADPDWDLVRVVFDGALQSQDGRATGPSRLVPVAGANTAAWAETSPRPIMVRLKEKAETHQKFSAGVADQEPRDDHGVLRMAPSLPGEVECYDYPLLQAFLSSFAPVGERDFRLDELVYLRIVQQQPPTAADLASVHDAGITDPYATPVSLGIHARSLVVAEIPLEADGSFYAQVPTQVPLILQGLDADRMALHAMNRWFYLQPGEKLTFSIPRSIFPTRCGGCHGSLTGDAEQVLGPPDVVSGASRVMATWDPVAEERREPAVPEPLSIDYARDVQPILDGHCVSCHEGDDAPGGLDLRGDPAGPWTVSYRALHALRDPESGNNADKRYLDERQALSSRSALLEKILGRELDAPATLSTPGLTHPAEDPLDPDEVLTLIRWIDLGATFEGAEG